MATERRHQRLSELLKEQIGEIVLREEEWSPGVVVTVTEVGLSDDLEHANVSISVLPEEFSKEVFQKLRSDIGELQRILNRRMRTRPVPKIRFSQDMREAEASRIEAELHRLQSER